MIRLPWASAVASRPHRPDTVSTLQRLPEQTPLVLPGSGRGRSRTDLARSAHDCRGGHGKLANF